MWGAKVLRLIVIKCFRTKAICCQASLKRYCWVELPTALPRSYQTVETLSCKYGWHNNPTYSPISVFNSDVQVMD